MSETNYEDMMLMIPPHNIDAEKFVIGGILVDPNKLADVLEFIDVTDFYARKHVILFNHLVKISEAGGLPELITVADSLQASNDLEDIGGMGYLMEIAKGVPSTANIGAYASVVKDRSKQRSLINASGRINEIAYNSELSTEEKISESQATLLGLESHDGEGAAQANSAIKQVIADIEERFHSDGKPLGIMTGLKDVDEHMGGLRKQNLMILAARPSMGKTTLAMNIAERVCHAGEPVLVFSAEMSKVELMERMVSSASNINFNRIRMGTLEEDDWSKLSAGISKLKDTPLYLDDRGGMTVNQVMSSARKQHKKHGIKLIIVDYLQLLSAKSQSREQEVSSISRGLKAMAKELDVPVIALSQLSRKCEERPNKRPMMSDLRDSGAIEQDADIVTFIYRDEVYNEDTEHKGIAEIIFLKCRNFSKGTVFVASRLDVCRFDNLEFKPAPLEDRPKKRGGFNYE
jgi:replicative DNA helicase